MTGKTIAGEIRRIRRLLKADVDGRKAVMSCDQYGEFLQHLDNIETMSREMQAKLDKSQSAMKAAMDARDCMEKVTETLKRALQDVLDVDTEYYTLSNAEDALDACRKAQRIIEESGVLDGRVGETGDADY